MARVIVQHHKILVMVCINIANLLCHSVYSVLAAFFPQEAKAKGMSDDAVGITFALFAAVIFICSPFAGRLMSTNGKVWVYMAGLVIVSFSTISFSVASLLPAGAPFATWCLLMRLLQGVGSAMEETAAYAIIADIDTERVSLYLGICEISTGLGYMVGPPLGGSLFSLGGFAAPFLILGLALLPTAALIYYKIPPDNHRLGKEESRTDVTMQTLLRNPQVVVIALASMLANSDYAFLEPTLGAHLADQGLANTPDAIGMLFSVSSITYTLACPVIGVLANRERFGPRPIIVSGLLLQLLGFMLIGPSPLLRLKSLQMGQMITSLVLFGVGESMSMTPVMDDMMNSCGGDSDACVNSLSSVMAASFSLGQMLGPLIGSALTSRFSFAWACTAMALVLLIHTSFIMIAEVWSPRPRLKDTARYMELSLVNAPDPESAVAD